MPYQPDRKRVEDLAQQAQREVIRMAVKFGYPGDK